MSILVHPIAPTPPGFDPFLRDTDGADVAEDEEGVMRALSAVRSKEVVVACDAASFVGTGVVSDHLTVEVRGHCPVKVGQELAVSDHRGFRYVGYRAVVGAVCPEAGRTILRLFTPRTAVFYPGRRFVRLDGVLGAHITVEVDQELIEAEGVDISMGGVGLIIPSEAGFVVGEAFLVHMRFPDATLSLPAIVRSADVRARQLRLGVEFAGCDAHLQARIRTALTER